METRDDAALLAARVLMSALFIADGLAKFPGYEGSLAYFHGKGFPLLPYTVWLAILIEVGGGVALLVGFQTRIAAATLALFCAVAAMAGHAFWNLPPGGARIGDLYHFAKDFGLAGGFVGLAVAGPGRLSVDAWRTPHVPVHRASPVG